MPPNVIGPYRVLETLGTGGVGTVYRALDRRTNESVALKLLSTGPALDARSARRLAREFETLADLSHPNVVRVFDTGVHQGYPYLAMELVEGLTLRHYLSLETEPQLSLTPSRPSGLKVSAPPVPEDGTSGSYSYTPFNLSAFAEESPSLTGEFTSLGPESVRALADAVDEPDTLMSYDGELEDGPPVEEMSLPPPALDIDLGEINRPERVGRLKDAMLQLCQALAYVHGHGLVHRDLKPSNVMVDQDRLVRLMDFGLAKFLADDVSVTGTGQMVGTFRYMAPEQILGETVDARADLYSLGIILYELLAGRAPFDARSPYELCQRVLETEAPPLFSFNPRGDLQLARVAHRLILKDANDRYQTAEEVYDALSE
ncbi:MAG TPA: serine/threonine-protein kinase [Myxococcaceae bacterium]|nr:serine/threonine-protein kinase [Myxococcaceae bacterium]